MRSETWKNDRSGPNQLGREMCTPHRTPRTRNRKVSYSHRKLGRPDQNHRLEKLRTPPTFCGDAWRQEAPDLETLRSVLAEFDGCALKAPYPTCVADGAPGSRSCWWRGPGEGEIEGASFVGGTVNVDRMLGTVGLNDRIFIVANVVSLATSRNRTPTPQETQICLPFIERQIDLADMEYLVCSEGRARALWRPRRDYTRAGSWLPYPRRTGRESQALAMLIRLSATAGQRHKRSLGRIASACTRARTLSR